MYEYEPRIFSEDEAMQLFRDLELFVDDSGIDSYVAFCVALMRDKPELYSLFDSCRGWSVRRSMRLYCDCA